MNIDLCNEMYIDIFKEVANIGASHSTAALASMIGDTLRMSVPNVRIIKLGDIAGILGEEEQIVSSTLLAMSGDVNGIMMNIFDEQTTLRIIEMVLHRKFNSLLELGAYETSFLKEIGNILTSAYLSALGTFTNLRIVPSIPNLAIDMAAAILSVPAIQYGIMSDEILLIENMFSSRSEKLTGYYLMVPDEESFAKILTSLGVKL